jgi:NAD(P)-dependent dehydrogenase (short-subunit alcohol dehydrogenase family)
VKARQQLPKNKNFRKDFPMLQLQGHVAVITGAAGGIGSAIAKRFAGEGSSVALLDKDTKRLKAVAKEIVSLGGEAEAFIVDITDSKDVAKAVKTVAKKFGKITLLVNAIGLLKQGKVDEMSEKDFDALMAVNVKGVFLAYKYVVPIMKKMGGVIINLSSVSAFVGSAESFAYTTSKGAVQSMTYATAQELAPHNIRVMAICPGWVNAGFTETALKLAPDPEVLLEAAKNAHVLGRMATPEEVANAALFLASDQASFMTGSALYVDGGFMIKR